MKRFESMTADDWEAWINEFLGGGDCDPPVPEGDEEPDLKLIGLFRDLSKLSVARSSANRLRRALGRCLQCRAPIAENAQDLYFLLNATSIIRPPKSKRLLLRYLEEGALHPLEYRNVDLATLALAVRCDFDTDDEVVDFIYRSAENHVSFSYHLTCLRMLAKRDTASALSFLERILPRLKSPARQTALGRTVRGITKRSGFRAIYRWYTERELFLESQYGDYFKIFKEIMKIQLKPWAADLPKDPYAVLFCALLHSGEVPFSAREISEIAMQAQHPRMRTDQRAPEETLSYVWRKSVDLASDWASSPLAIGTCPPWVEWLSTEPDTYELRTSWTQDASTLRPSIEQRDQVVRLDAESHENVIVKLISATKVREPHPPSSMYNSMG